MSNKLDVDFLNQLHDLERAATNLKNEFRSYNFKDYIESERDMKNLKIKVGVLYKMMENMVENKIAMMGFAHQCIEFRRQMIKKIGEDQYVSDLWDTLMSAIALTQ